MVNTVQSTEPFPREHHSGLLAVLSPLQQRGAGGRWVEHTHRAFLAGLPPLVPLHLQWGHQLETSSPPHFIPSPGTFVDLFHCQKLARHAETQPGRLLEYSTDGSSVTANTGCERLQFCIVTVRAGH